MLDKQVSPYVKEKTKGIKFYGDGWLFYIRPFYLGALEVKDLQSVTIDTTVQEKAVAFPTDVPLLTKAIEKLGETTKDAGVSLRQSYVRVSKTVALMAGRYAHIKQFNMPNNSNGKNKGLSF